MDFPLAYEVKNLLEILLLLGALNSNRFTLVWEKTPLAKSLLGGRAIPPQASFDSPFLETLSLFDFSMLMNDPIKHNQTWPRVPYKMPIDIPKFDTNLKEDRETHIPLITYGAHPTHSCMVA